METSSNKPLRRRYRRSRLSAIAVAMASVLFISAPTAASAALATNFGAGTLEGTLNFRPAVPPLNTPCQLVTFTFRMKAVAVLGTSTGNQFAGVIGLVVVPLHPLFSGGMDITGSGFSRCENATVGGGTITVNAFSARNLVTQNTVLCTAMTGGYVRTGTDVNAEVGATGLGQGCKVNSQGTGTIGHTAVALHAELTPTAPGAGVTVGVSLAVLVGTFVVVPA